MRGSWVAAGALAVGLLAGPSLRAGLYTADGPTPGPVVTARGVEPMPFRVFHDDVIIDLPLISVPVLAEGRENPRHKQYLARRDQLLARAKAGTLTAADRVNLSECLVRLRQYAEAVELLTPAARSRETRDFRVFANLATAAQHAGELQQAADYLRQAQDYWPKEAPGLSPEQLAWYQKVERYHLKLLRLRNREALQARGLPPGERPRGAESVDALFTDDKGQPVRFVGEGGPFEAGRIAEAERAKLPPDALAIVQQLLVWLPDDTRLYWLLGELLNARGDVAAADTVFRECVDGRRYSAAELQEHRRVVRAARQQAEEAAAANTPAPPSWLPGRQQLVAVVGLAAVLLGLLGYFQDRELVRRRHGAGARGG